MCAWHRAVRRGRRYGWGNGDLGVPAGEPDRSLVFYEQKKKNNAIELNKHANIHADAKDIVCNTCNMVEFHKYEIQKIWK